MPGLQIAVDAVPRDPVLHAIVAPAEIEQCTGALASEFPFDFGRGPAEAGNKLPAVAPRRTETDMFGFEKDDRKAALGAGERGAKPGEAATDDRDVALKVAFDVALRLPLMRGRRIIAVVQRIGHRRRADQTRINRCSRSQLDTTD